MEGVPSRQLGADDESVKGKLSDVSSVYTLDSRCWDTDHLVDNVACRSLALHGRSCQSSFGLLARYRHDHSSTEQHMPIPPYHTVVFRHD